MNEADEIRIEVEGELSIFTAAAIREQILHAFEQGRAVAADLGKVADVDSAGLQLLLAARKEASARGQVMRVTHASQAVRDILALCGVAEQFELCDGDADGRPT